MNLDKNFFVKQDFTKDELDKYKKPIHRNLGIAKTSDEPEIIFHFSYMAFLKIGIYCLAKQGYRVKSRMGHHQKIIEGLSEILKSEDIFLVGDKMRKDRNLSMYSADFLSFREEIDEYLNFTEALSKKILS